MTVTTVLFDLDGTLSESAPGIIGSVRRALDELGLSRLDARTERAMVGPPMSDTLTPVVGADRVDEVIERYRRHYATAMFDTRCYDGILPMLDELRARGVDVAVATSKAEVYAERVVDHLGLRPYLRTVVGDSLGGVRHTKALVIGEALRRLADSDPSSVLMIGDRSHDVIGARAHGIDTIGAGWGYGAPGELTAAGAIDVVATPTALQAVLRRLLDPMSCHHAASTIQG